MPIAAPSANTSGRPSCTTAADVLEDMDGKIDGVVDGGPCHGGRGVHHSGPDLRPAPAAASRRTAAGGSWSGSSARSTVDKAVTGAAEGGGAAQGSRHEVPPLRPQGTGDRGHRHAGDAPPGRLPSSWRSPATASSALTSLPTCFPARRCSMPGPQPRTSGSRPSGCLTPCGPLTARDVTEIYAQCPDSRGLGLAIGNRLKKAAGFHVHGRGGSEQVVLGITGGTGAGKTSALRAIRGSGRRRSLTATRCTMRCWTRDEALRQRHCGDASAACSTPTAPLNRKKLGAAGL